MMGNHKFFLRCYKPNDIDAVEALFSQQVIEFSKARLKKTDRQLIPNEKQAHPH